MLALSWTRAFLSIQLGPVMQRGGMKLQVVVQCSLYAQGATEISYATYRCLG